MKQCEGQLSLFDLLPQQEDLETIPPDKMAEMIGTAVGVKLSWNERFFQYEGRIGKVTVSVEYDYFAEGVFGGRKFIGASVSLPHGGTSCPCDSITEAIEFIRRVLPKQLEWEKEYMIRNRGLKNE